MGGRRRDRHGRARLRGAGRRVGDHAGAGGCGAQGLAILDREESARQVNRVAQGGREPHVHDSSETVGAAQHQLAAIQLDEVRAVRAGVAAIVDGAEQT